MSEQNNTASEATEAQNSDSEQPQTGTPIAVEIKAETPEEEKESERPGFCCGSCS